MESSAVAAHLPTAFGGVQHLTIPGMMAHENNMLAGKLHVQLKVSSTKSIITAQWRPPGPGSDMEAYSLFLVEIFQTEEFVQ
jgi:hypothetical protein